MASAPLTGLKSCSASPKRVLRKRIRERRSSARRCRSRALSSMMEFYHRTARRAVGATARVATAGRVSTRGVDLGCLVRCEREGTGHDHPVEVLAVTQVSPRLGRASPLALRGRGGIAKKLAAADRRPSSTRIFSARISPTRCETLVSCWAAWRRAHRATSRQRPCLLAGHGQAVGAGGVLEAGDPNPIGAEGRHRDVDF